MFEFLDHAFRFADQPLLGFGDHEIVLAERDAGLAGIVEAHAHQVVGEDHRYFLTAMAIDLVDKGGDFLLGHHLVDQVEGNERTAGKDFVQQHAPRRRFKADDGVVPIGIDTVITSLNLRMKRYDAGIEGLLNLSDIDEGHSFPGLAVAFHGQVIKSEHDVLTGDDDRFAVGRAEDVVGGHHQDPGFQLGFQGQRHVHGHLVAVEVGIERRADQRMKLDGLALDQQRFEGLNAEPVQGRRPVQEHRMLSDNLLKNVPDFGTLLFEHPFRRLDGGRHAV